MNSTLDFLCRILDDVYFSPTSVNLRDILCIAKQQKLWGGQSYVAGQLQIQRSSCINRHNCRSKWPLEYHHCHACKDRFQNKPSVGDRYIPIKKGVVCSLFLHGIEELQNCLPIQGDLLQLKEMVRVGGLLRIDFQYNLELSAIWKDIVKRKERRSVLSLLFWVLWSSTCSCLLFSLSHIFTFFYFHNIFAGMYTFYTISLSLLECIRSVSSAYLFWNVSVLFPQFVFAGRYTFCILSLSFPKCTIFLCSQLILAGMYTPCILSSSLLWCLLFDIVNVSFH